MVLETRRRERKYHAAGALSPCLRPGFEDLGLVVADGRRLPHNPRESPGPAVAATLIPKTTRSRDVKVHQTAIVADGAVLGEGVEIGPYCIVGPRIRLGPRCRLHSHVVMEGDTVLGSDCEVFPFAAIGTKPQDKKLIGFENHGILRIGNSNTIREHVTIHAGTRHGIGITSIGDHNMLLAGCHIGHDARVGNHVVFTNAAMAAGHTSVADRAILGAMVGIHQFTRVGEMAMVGAGAMLTHDAPPFALVQGDRARLVGVNLVGLKRAGIGVEDSAAIKRAFRTLFWENGKLTDRIQSVRRSDLGHNPLVRKILDFVADSPRGVCRPRGGRTLYGRETGDVADV